MSTPGPLPRTVDLHFRDLRMQRLAEHLTDWIAAEVAAAGGSGAVFGLSGGIDSAVVAALAKRAFPHHTLGVVMPCHSDPQDAEDAAIVAHHFDVPASTVDLGTRLRPAARDTRRPAAATCPRASSPPPTSSRGCA